MSEKVILAGLGGQGMMLLGRLIAQAVMLEGKNVTFFPSYGTEVRGGTAYYHLTVSDEEISIYRSMLKKLGENLAELADEINIKTDITEDWFWSAAHHSCTTPMGSTEDDLIDKDLKLKFCDNVFVCDGSVIQEHSYANTGLAIGQLACRLAKKIRDDY